MRPLFKFSLLRIRNNAEIVDTKLRPIKYRGFTIQPVIINKLCRSHNFKYDAYVIPLSINNRFRPNTKPKWTRTTSSDYKDILILAKEDISYLYRPYFLINIWKIKVKLLQSELKK